MSRKRRRPDPAALPDACQAEQEPAEKNSPLPRCEWCLGSKDSSSRRVYMEYHDVEWGVPVVEDAALFELLSLEGAQAGLSWLTVLKKRAEYRRVFSGFDPERVARMGGADVARLLANPGIVRHRGKIEAVIGNAARVLEVQRECGSLGAFLWDFVGRTPLQSRWHAVGELPTSTPHAARMSAALRSRGFKFVGPTICYAFMQAAGMVNDHLVSCHRHEAVAQLAKSARIPRVPSSGGGEQRG